MGFETGPFIQAACLCEKVLQEKDGVLTLVRIVDVVTHTAGGPNPPEDMPPLRQNYHLVVMLKSGTAIGRYNLTVVPQKPDGSTDDPVGGSVHFEGEEKGVNFIVNLSYEFTMEGLYWFKLYLDDEKLTEIPFRVKYNRVVTGPIRSPR